MINDLINILRKREKEKKKKKKELMILIAILQNINKNDQKL